MAYKIEDLVNATSKVADAQMELDIRMAYAVAVTTANREEASRLCDEMMACTIGAEKQNAAIALASVMQAIARQTHNPVAIIRAIGKMAEQMVAGLPVNIDDRF